jgi:hypothetical protein
MRSLKFRLSLSVGAVVCLAGAMVPRVTASAAVARPAHLVAAAPHTGKATKQVIIVLRQKNTGLAARSEARLAAVRAEQAPIIRQLRSVGALHISSTSVLNAIIATVPAREATLLAANPAVAEVIPNGTIRGPAVPTVGTSVTGSASPRSVPTPACGTAGSPELDPEALTNINAPQAQALGFDGAGVTVAFLADGVDTTNPDLQRNTLYASAGSSAGSPVITRYADFSGDGITAATAGGEAFLDVSSIAAQGNQVYDLSNFVNAAHSLPSGCDIKIVGSAPGSSVLALKVFGQNNDTTTSGFIQAINYAVSNGAKVINESFGANQFPDTTLDAIRDADDAAVAAGTTVVVSSGDAGITSTIGSPASDPNVISVGATTTFRAYSQVTYGGINDPNANGSFVDNNISDLSSGGFTQAGNTVDLVAPGDLNFALCTANTSLYADCTNEQQTASNIELSGGTSESSPLTAGAAADVIQAYAASHGGTDPSPALVKQILMSTATDIAAPAVEQGAGLLNIEAAVKEAQSLPGTTASSPAGGLLVRPNQINISQTPGATNTQAIHVTNTGTSSVTVNLSTRKLTQRVASQSSSFCMQPGTATVGCPANTGSFPIWSGVTEVYQDETFTVPATSGTSRLQFAADYQFTGQSSLLHFALIEPDGTYAGYSLPQGLGDYGEIEVANPPAGTWTAVFFTEQDGATAGAVGTSGTVQWNASTYQATAGGSLSAPSLTIAAGATASVNLSVKSPRVSGDTDQAVVVSSGAATTTIPVTVRTTIPVGARGATFKGVLTGGNGRGGAPAQMNTYVFNVPAGKTDLDVGVSLSTDPGETLLGFLVDPSGQTVGYSSNVTTDNFGTPFSTQWLNIYHVAPQAGQWKLVLDWLNPVTGNELTEPFTGSIAFNQVSTSNNLPQSSSTVLRAGHTYDYKVKVNNTGVAPETYFVDPRLNKTATITLPDQNGSATGMTLPLPPGLSFPYYFVPTNTSQLKATLTGSVPVTFDLEYFPGDPDVSPAITEPGVTGSTSGDTSRLTLTEPQVSPGLWLLNPDEIGPFPSGGAPSATATATFKAVTQAFDTTVSSSTGDFWTSANGLSGSFTPMYVPAGDSTTITVAVTPTAAVGTIVKGTLYVDDFVIGSFGPALPTGDQLAALPYSYKVGPHSSRPRH